MGLALALFVLAGSSTILAENPPAGNSPAANQDDFVYDSKGKKDPFLPGEPVWTAERTVTRLKESSVDGIVWDQTNALVIIEGKVLRRGDAYLGSRLESIEKDKAIFSVGEQRIVVPVVQPKEEDKKE